MNRLPRSTPATPRGSSARPALVFLMNPGLAFFYAGLVRRKNTLNTLMMTYVAMGTGALVWMVAGYSLAFAPGSPFLGGLRWLGLSGRGRGAGAGLRGHRPASRLRRVSGHVRDDHAGPDLGRDRRADELSRLRPLHRPLEPRRVRAGRALGLGHGRLPARLGRARLRRRDGRARDGGDRRSRRRDVPRPAAGPQAHRADPAQRPLRAPRLGPPVVRLVRLQRGIGARGQRDGGARVRHDERRRGVGASHLDPPREPLRGPRDGGRRRDGRGRRARRHHARAPASCRRSPRSRSGRSRRSRASARCA